MAFESGSTGTDSFNAFRDILQGDLKNLSLETKKKYPQIKESCEEAINKLRNAANTPQTPIYYVINQIMYPLVQGCDTKDTKVIKCCLQIIQRLITQRVVDAKGARYITDTLWSLMESGIEEVKVLQSVTLLLTTNTVVHGETLSKILVLCFRLHFAKNSTTINTAGATVRQLVSLVFERVVAEDEHLITQSVSSDVSQLSLSPSEGATLTAAKLDELKVGSGAAPKDLPPCAADAFLLFQDLVQLVNADQPYWLLGMTEMTRTFGLELLESVLAQFSSVFYKNAEFSFLLKERVCALVIKLFSPNIKYRNSVPASVQQATPFDKPYFPISMRLLRVVSVLIQRYHILLVTECEIFLSLIVKFLDPDKPVWQRALALEVLHKMTVQPALINSFCECYDLKRHTTSIFKDIVNSLGAYVQSLFIMQQVPGQTPLSILPGAGLTTVGGSLGGPGISPQAGFLTRTLWLPIVVTFPAGQHKSCYLDMLEKIEPPSIPEGYGISMAYACLLDIIRSMQISIGVDIVQEPQQNVIHTQMEDSTEGNVLLTTSANTETDRDKQNQFRNKSLDQQLIESSWCGLLAALCPLMEASTDETVTETILKAMQTYAALCGQLELSTPRDAFITSICKASLPPHYALTVLNTVAAAGFQLGNTTGGVTFYSEAVAAAATVAATDYRQQVVAVGTPLPTASIPVGTQQGPVMLTAKNLQAMRALLSLAHCHGGILGTAWHLVLTTLQHLVWILGLKPSTGGCLKAGGRAGGAAGNASTTIASAAATSVNANIAASNAAVAMASTSDNANAVITTAVMADLPVLSQMLSKLFESSQYLDDVALHHLINALCKLSQEAMELAYSNREPSLFAVAKLLETGIVNMGRVPVLWRPLTNHLLEVCHHPHIRMREWGVEAVTYLVKSALHYKHAVPLRDNQKLQTLLLGPLAELSAVPHGDVRQRQLECVLQILHGAGETLTHGWPLILGIIGAVSDHQGENLIRIAFQCLQLVIMDFLPVMSWRCLPLCVDTVSKFGSQIQELNISLTAVGLMWNISDYFHQNQAKLSTILGEDAPLPDFPGTPNMPGFDRLWMCLYGRLAGLCVDGRPAVRKSAGQTLFSTISAHGSLLRPATWQAVLWQVLFPLLDKVGQLSSSASSEKVDSGANILIHHSRNTAQKQWAETQVMTLSGVARVFNTKRQLLQALGDFQRAWSVLLGHIERSALTKNNEVSFAALKAFQEILYLNKSTSNQTSKPSTTLATDAIRTPPSTTVAATGAAEDNSVRNNVNNKEVWAIAWHIWLRIGTSIGTSIGGGNNVTSSSSDNQMISTVTAIDEPYVPSQAFLTALIQIFPNVYQHIKAEFTIEDLKKLCVVLTSAVCLPVSGESNPYILSTGNEFSLSALHDGALHAVELVQKETVTHNHSKMLPEIFRQLLVFSRFSCSADPKQIYPSNMNTSTDWLATNYIPFGEKALSAAVALYRICADNNAVVSGNVLYDLVKALHVPLALKYDCPSSSTWKLAANSLVTVLNIGLPVARTLQQGQSLQYSGMWEELAVTLNDFLFPKTCASADRGLDEIVADEAIDCQLIELLRSQVLPYSGTIPKEFCLKIVVLLNRGSIHSATSVNQDLEMELTLREEFAKTCFETLLQFSLVDEDVRSGEQLVDSTKVKMGLASTDPSSIQMENELAGRLAVTALLHRFQDVLRKYIEDEKQSGKCPLPRYRLSEISFVLKAVTTVIVSMKKSNLIVREAEAWEQLISLYPYLVECTTTSSSQVSRPLREALLQFTDLLQPPTNRQQLSNGNDDIT